MKISHSDVDATLLCARKGYYGGALNLQRKKLSQALNRGIAMHDILAYFFTHLKDNHGDYSGAREVAIARRNELAMQDPSMMEFAEQIVKMFDSFYSLGWFKGYKVLGVEEKMSINISDTLIYPFTVDLILEDPGGNIAVVDHKTTYQFYAAHQIELSSQLPKYIGAMRVLGRRADYAIYHQLRYRTKKDYTVDDVIQLVKFTPSVPRIQTTFTEQIMIARKIEVLRQYDIEEQSRQAIRTANNLVCNSCSYKDLCIEELNGRPIDLMIEALYEERGDRYLEIEDSSMLEIEG